MFAKRKCAYSFFRARWLWTIGPAVCQYYLVEERKKTPFSMVEIAWLLFGIWHLELNSIEQFTWAQAIQIKSNEKQTGLRARSPSKREKNQLNGYTLHMQTMVISAFCVLNKSNNKSNFKTPFPIHGPTQTIIIWQITAIVSERHER